MPDTPDHTPLDDDGQTRPTTPADSEYTRPNPATREPQHPPPPPGQGHVRPRDEHPLSGRRGRRRRKRPPSRQDSGLYLPVWSLALMLLVVLGLSFGIVALVVGLGGATAPMSEPTIRIITAVPSNTPNQPAAQPALPTASPTPFDQGIQGPVPTFALEGPTLEPVYLSPTPERIAVGKSVTVIDVNPQELNIRDEPGINSNVLFRVSDGTRFVIVEGPTQADGLTWWRVQNPANAGETGWAAANYLQVAPQQ